MISLTHIERLFRTESYGRLVERVLANGRRVNRAVAKHLEVSDAVAAAACGLALQRCCELTYAPTPLAKRLAMQLLQMQRSDGHFSRSVAASAVALRGLLDYLQHHRDVGEAVDAQVSAAVAEALAALGRTQSVVGALHDNAVESTIVLWQLGDNDAFKSACPALDRCGDLLGVTELDKIAPAAA